MRECDRFDEQQYQALATKAASGAKLSRAQRELLDSHRYTQQAEALLLRAGGSGASTPAAVPDRQALQGLIYFLRGGAYSTSNRSQQLLMAALQHGAEVRCCGPALS